MSIRRFILPSAIAISGAVLLWRHPAPRLHRSLFSRRPASYLQATSFPSRQVALRTIKQTSRQYAHYRRRCHRCRRPSPCCPTRPQGCCCRARRLQQHRKHQQQEYQTRPRGCLLPQKAIYNLDYNQYMLVKEALKERKHFLQTASHLSSWTSIMLLLVSGLPGRYFEW